MPDDQRDQRPEPYEALGIGPVPPGSRPDAFSYSSGGDEQVSIRGIHVPPGQRGAIGPRADHVVFWLGDGHATLTDDRGGEWHVAAGHPRIMSATGTYAFTTDATRMTLLHLEAEFVERVAVDAGMPTRSPRLFDQQDDLAVALEPLRTLLRRAGTHLMDPALPAADREVLNRRIARVVLVAFPESGRPVRDTRLDLALRFVHDHLEDEVTVGDIAAAADLSERGLQQAFHRTLDVSPMRYLRDLRLDRVHVQLAGGATSVGETAARWRFAHLGRFAAAYRSRFGESPSDTVRRARG